MKSWHRSRLITCHHPDLDVFCTVMISPFAKLSSPAFLLVKLYLATTLNCLVTDVISPSSVLLLLLLSLQLASSPSSTDVFPSLAVSEVVIVESGVDTIMLFSASVVIAGEARV